MEKRQDCPHAQQPSLGLCQASSKGVQFLWRSQLPPEQGGSKGTAGRDVPCSRAWGERPIEVW